MDPYDSDDSTGDRPRRSDSDREEERTGGTWLQGLGHDDAKDKVLKDDSDVMMTWPCASSAAHTIPYLAEARSTSSDNDGVSKTQPSTMSRFNPPLSLYCDFRRALARAKQWVPQIASPRAVLGLAYMMCVLLSQWLWPIWSLGHGPPNIIRAHTHTHSHSQIWQCERPPPIPLPPHVHLFHHIPNATFSLSQARRAVDSHCSPADLEGFHAMLFLLGLDDDHHAPVSRLPGTENALVRQLHRVLRGTSDEACHVGVVAALGWIQLFEMRVVDRLLRPDVAEVQRLHASA
ncbi:hypothetical protein AC578_5847 [Pseudocercospora eumusae]|uniref:Uncharacterized protein n=1 Tax=Pseudocercospora eumusae TaxID=321146 RepID=A0A139GXP3_9PEZI|nr:hypothetical protein AC578_5847 [Pseudocercospora eumusae]